MGDFKWPNAVTITTAGRDSNRDFPQMPPIEKKQLHYSPGGVIMTLVIEKIFGVG